MVAPITARPCYYYRTLIWEWKQQGKNRQWVKVAGECMHLPFFVDDNTGRLLVDPRGAALDLHRDFEQEFCDSFFTTKDPAPDNVRTFLARYGIVTNNKIKVEEFCIKPKNSLFLLGTLSENPGLEVSPEPVRDAEPVNAFASHEFSLSLGSLSFLENSRPNLDVDFARQFAIPPEEPADQVVSLSPSDSTGANASSMTQQQKIAAALRQAGISNPAAWAAAGMRNPGVPVLSDPTGTALNGNESGSNGDLGSAPQDNAFDSHPPVVLMKGANNKTFLISWRSQQEVARSLGWKCTLMIWGGPALALLSLYVFLSIRNLL